MHMHVLSWLSAAAIVVMTHPRLVVMITVDLHAASLFTNTVRGDPTAIRESHIDMAFRGRACSCGLFRAAGPLPPGGVRNRWQLGRFRYGRG